MKNFFKKLSFVLAIAMVLTSIAPATASAAEVVPAKKVNVKVDGEKVDTINLTVGETETVKIGLPVKKAFAGQKSTYKTWAVTEGTAVEVVRVGNKNYELTAVEAGEATITFGAAKTKKLAKAGEFAVAKEVTVVVEDGFGIVDVTAKKVNKLEVTFAAPVDTDKVALTVNKGANAVDHKVEWNADKTVATITTTAKMTVGTYTVKATAEDVTAEQSVEIENQKVDKIVILNDVALTGKAVVKSGEAAVDAGEAYVYYQVLDQYGEDLTASTSIQWSTSCGTPNVRRAEGKLTVQRSDEKAFTFGEQIYVTGVYTKTGVSVQATLTVGTAQALHSIEMAGFVKKNTTTLVQSLPAGFKSGEYYLVYNAVDQNGNPLTPSDAWGEEVTFITDNVLVVREIKGGDTTLVVDGHEYNAVQVVPGDFVSNGGEINVTAIATKTGNKSLMNYVVGENKILTSFTMSDPVGLTLDGEKFAIPFEALDQNGEKITNFTTIADNLNKITFTVSENGAAVRFKANNDGTATLYYEDRAVAWNESLATDGIDRTVSVTTVVVGGNSDNLMLSISDKARPDAIKSEGMTTALVEGGEAYVGNLGIYGKTFVFIDQYGREMVNDYTNTTWTTDGYDFFEASAAKDLKGTDFAHYTFNVIAEYKGSDDATNLNNNGKYVVNLANGGMLVVTADAKTKTALTGNTIKYTIAKTKDANLNNVDAYEDITPAYNKTFAVVDINQVKNFTVADLNKQYVNIATISDKANGEQASKTGTALDAAVAEAMTIDADHQQKVSVVGYYNGTKVSVPAQYYTVVGSKLTTATPGALGVNKLTAVIDGSIKYSDIFDVNTANYLRKDTSDSVKVTIYEVYSNEAIAASGVAIGSFMDITGTTCAAILKDSVVKNVVISDAAPYLAKINAPAASLVNPTDTGFSAYAILMAIEAGNHYYAGHNNAGLCTFLDQYGVEYWDETTVSFKIASIVEAPGYAENNFTVMANDTIGCEVKGAECGDTFVLTITATDGKVTLTHDVQMVVGADNSAVIVNGNNFYTEDLVPVLEGQRADGLK